MKFAILSVLTAAMVLAPTQAESRQACEDCAGAASRTVVHSVSVSGRRRSGGIFRILGRCYSVCVEHVGKPAEPGCEPAAPAVKVEITAPVPAVKPPKPGCEPAPAVKVDVKAGCIQVKVSCRGRRARHRRAGRCKRVRRSCRRRCSRC